MTIDCNISLNLEQYTLVITTTLSLLVLYLYDTFICKLHKRLRSRFLLFIFRQQMDERKIGSILQILIVNNFQQIMKRKTHLMQHVYVIVFANKQALSYR